MFLRIFGRHSQGWGKFDHPICVAIDASDMVYVSELDYCRISVFTSEGQFVMMFGRKGKGPGELVDPRGLAVDSWGVVYVCDTDNNRVQVF
jgi:DNA-binding beta-propeller fold protein YncE